MEKIVAERSETMNVESTGSAHYVWVLGRVHNQLGGPARTITGYIRGLKSLGQRVDLCGLGERRSLAENFSEAGVDKLHALSGPRRGQWRALNTVYERAAVENSTVVIVGLWHLPFFVIAMRKGLARILQRRRQPRVLLVPTMSLSAYDWKKHELVKRGLRPLVAGLLWGIDGVVFASSGELTLSSPRTWRRSTVVLHPTTAPIEPKGSREKPTWDVAFVGRIDPQKDLPLLFRGLTLCESKPSLVVVGDGNADYVRELKKLADELGIADQVRWLGWKSHPDALAVLRASKVVAVTSIVENFCHVALEAIANEAEVVLVDRVMSSSDFRTHASVSVVRPNAKEIGIAIDGSLKDWKSRDLKRRASAEKISEICSPENAARNLMDFAVR